MVPQVSILYCPTNVQETSTAQASWAVMSASGIAFTFQHSGHVEGTSAGLPFGTPNRNDDFIVSGNNPSITHEFDGLIQGAAIRANLDGTDKLVGGLAGALGDLVNVVAQDLNKSVAAGVVALVFG
jgi:hypothetical protein